MRDSLAEHFWANVKKRKSGCWEWTAGTTVYGYGQLRVKSKGKVLYAHRIAWFLYTGKWPTKPILHTCDNPPCVRRKHLYEGTHLDNMQDCVKRGRRPKGEQHGYATLTEAKVRVIRLKHLPDKVWAKKFSVHTTTIQYARTGKTWTHIKNPPPVRRNK